jgi:hypothetical protein
MVLSRHEIDRKFDEQARLYKTAEPPTPGHAAAEAANEYAADNEEAAQAERRRRRIQHEVDPYLHEAPEVASFDVGKMYRDALDMPENPGYPAMRPVSAESFRRVPVIAGEAACSPGYDTPGLAVPVPSATLSAAAIARPLLTDGQSRPCAPEAC